MGARALASLARLETCCRVEIAQSPRVGKAHKDAALGARANGSNERGDPIAARWSPNAHACLLAGRTRTRSRNEHPNAPIASPRQPMSTPHDPLAQPHGRDVLIAV